MLWLIIIGVIFYHGAKRRALIPIAWAFIGIGSFIAGLFLGIGIVWVLSNFVRETLELFFVSILVGLAALGFAYWYMDHYAKKQKSAKNFLNENLLDDRYLDND